MGVDKAMNSIRDWNLAGVAVLSNTKINAKIFSSWARIIQEKIHSSIGLLITLWEWNSRTILDTKLYFKTMKNTTNLM